MEPAQSGGRLLLQNCRSVVYRARWFIFAALFVALSVELIIPARKQSQTFDESCHLYAGYESLVHFDFGINPEHPPLVKYLAALPLLKLKLNVPSPMPVEFKLDCALRGRDFLYSNNAGQILFRSRMAVATLTLLLFLLIFMAAAEMFSLGPAFIALTLAVFEPNLVANGALVLTDMGVTCFLFATVYAFWRYVRRPSAFRLLICAVAAGLALASKHSGPVVFVVLGLLALAELAVFRKNGTPERKSAWKRSALRLASALVVIVIIAWAILWASYGFRFRPRPSPLEINPPLAAYIHVGQRDRRAKQVILWVWDHHLLPGSYIYGLADVAIALRGRPAFVMGKRYPAGRWFYFPVLFFFKSTLGFLALFFLMLTAFVKGWVRLSRETVFNIVPPALYFAIAMRGKLNLGIRHILPIYPFLIVLIAFSAWRLIQRNRRWAALVCVLIAFHIAAAVRAFPDYGPYSNELWGGESRTYLLAATDAGPALKTAGEYLAAHHITNCWLAYSGFAEPAYYGIRCHRLPGQLGYQAIAKRSPFDVTSSTLQGTVLIDPYEFDTGGNGPPQYDPYFKFSHIKPFAIIDGSILVFKGRFEVPRLAALSHALEAWQLLRAHKPEEALEQARRAVELDPSTATNHVALGDALAAMNRKREAQKEYLAALPLASAIDHSPESEWVFDLQDRLRKLSKGKADRMPMIK